MRRLNFEKLECRLLLASWTDLGLPDAFQATWQTRAAEGESAAEALAGNTLVTSDPAPQQMPSVAVNPQNPDHVVIAYLDYSLLDTGYAGLGIAVSRDGGANFTTSSVSLPAGFEQGAADPVVRFDDQGRVFVVFMAVTFWGPRPPLANPSAGAQRAYGFEASNGVFVARSDNGGDSWAAAVPVASRLYNGGEPVPFDIIPDLAIDRFATLPDGQSNPRHGSLYVTFSRYYPPGQFPGQPDATGGSDVFVATSRDAGQTWQIQVQTNSEGMATTVLQDPFNNGRDPPAGFGYNNYVHPTVGPEGDIYVSEYTGGWFTVNRSSDGGASFFVPTQEDEFGMPFGLGPVGLDFGLTSNEFRTFPVRAIIADPARPGHVYVAEPQSVLDRAGGLIDDSDIIFSRSTDYGQTWDRVIRLNGRLVDAINDDNLGQKSQGSRDDVTASQVMVRLATNSQGWLAAIWYDSRRDPANHRLDVFGAISRDGGATFGPNFRLTDQSFAAEAGAYLDAADESTTYLGDSLGLELTDDSLYAAWTDTRAGNQNIAFTRLPLESLTALNDRFEPNESLNDVTSLGVVIDRYLPRLALDEGDEDWFTLETAATGQLNVVVGGAGSEAIEIELRDAAGQPIEWVEAASLAGDGPEAGRRWSAAIAARQHYFVRITAPQTVANYSLSLEAYTADLGPLAHRVVEDQLHPDDEIYYLARVAADGSFSARFQNLAAQTEPLLELLDPTDLSVLGSNAEGATAKTLVTAGQRLLIHLRGNGESTLPYRLELTNLDQFSDSDYGLFRYEAGAGPSQSVTGDFDGDGLLDVAVTNAGANTISLLLSNGDGTFNAPRQFDVGAFHTPNPVADDFSLPTYRRDAAAADFNQDGLPDLAVTNFDASDVSVLLGRGDGTFQPQRRFDATGSPFGITTGDVNGDQRLDILVVEGAVENSSRQLAVLLGRGDGTFEPQRLQALEEVLTLPTLALADLNHDQKLDLIVAGGLGEGMDVYLGQGDGVFTHRGHFSGGRQSGDLVVEDINGDGQLDVLAPSLTIPGHVVLLTGRGDGTFDEPRTFLSGEGPIAIALVDWGSEEETDDGVKRLGPRDGRLDLVVANSGASLSVARPGPPEVVVLPQLTDENGEFVGFGAAHRIADAQQPLDLEIVDFDSDGLPDVGVVDRQGLYVVFAHPSAIPPHDSRLNARDLGRVVHLVQPTLTITPSRSSVFYRLEVPTEAVAGARDEIMDISAGFAHLEGPGLRMEVLDADGRLLATGDRVRLRAPQGATLYVHIFGVEDAGGEAGGGVGTGSYTLVIDALPQVVSIESQALLPGRGGAPGGAVNTLVIALQGDRLRPESAENADHYHIVYLGEDGRHGTSDDRVIPLGGPGIAQPVVYDPSANRDITTGLSYPTAVHQTITLVFAEPLPSGSYVVELSDEIQSAAFNDDETGKLSLVESLGGHPVAQFNSASGGGEIAAGTRLEVIDLVTSPASGIDFSAFGTGTRFLTQLQNDLQALLDAALSELGDSPAITDYLLQHILDRVLPGLEVDQQRATSLVILFFDPFPFAITQRGNDGRLDYNRQANTLERGLPQAYVQVGRNLDLVVIPQAAGTYQLDIASVPQLPRMGAIVLGPSQTEVYDLTSRVRVGDRSFQFQVTGAASASPSFRGALPLDAVRSEDSLSRQLVPTDAASYSGASALPWGSATMRSATMLLMSGVIDSFGARGIRPSDEEDPSEKENPNDDQEADEAQQPANEQPERRAALARPAEADVGRARRRPMVGDDRSTREPVRDRTNNSPRSSPWGMLFEQRNEPSGKTLVQPAERPIKPATSIAPSIAALIPPAAGIAPDAASENTGWQRFLTSVLDWFASLWSTP